MLSGTVYVFIYIEKCLKDMISNIFLYLYLTIKLIFFFSKMINVVYSYFTKNIYGCCASMKPHVP